MTPEETNTTPYVQYPKPDPIKIIKGKVAEAEHFERNVLKQQSVRADIYREILSEFEKEFNN